jgi:hypothetical protein
MRRWVITLVLPLILAGQDFRATISGQVTDASGSAIPGAKVKATQRSTDEVFHAVTNQDGYYTLPYLQPSTYDVEAEATGFTTLRRADVTLMVAEKLDLPIRMELGKVSETITVVAEVADLKTADASGGLNFDSLMTSEYPLNGGQVYMLMDLTPGVLFTQEQFGASGYSGTRGWDVSGAYVMNGGVSGTNSFSLNGAPISLTGTWQLAPNRDAIQEFKVMVNTYDASIGRTGGGSVNTTLKSGSNTLHGTMFEYLRNSVLDANWTQNNMVGAPRGKHITNQFGGTVGGAIRRDKDFFFASFEGFRERVPFPVVSNTPPLDLRDGQHFTAYKMTVNDPLTGHTCVNKVDVSGTCSSTYIRSPFPGNVIPSSRISPIAQTILSYYPAPNIAGLTQNYVFSNNTGKYRYDQPMFRWDRVLDEQDRVYALFTYQHGHEYRDQTFPGPSASGNIWTERTNFNIITDWTRILKPTWIFDLRASFGRFTSYFPYADQYSGVTAQTLGMNVPHAPTSKGVSPPRFTVDQFSDLFGNNSNLFTWGTDNQWNIVPTFTTTRGTKTIRFGADLVYAMQGNGSVGAANGLLQFTRYATQQYPLRAGSSTDGSGIADLLLGMAGNGFVDWNDTYYRTWPYFGFFVQNDWKVRRNVTLNLGLRYDVQLPFVERWNRVNNGFDFNAVNPLSDAALAAWRQNQAAYNATNPAAPYPAPPAALLGGKSFVQPGGNRRTYGTDWQDVQPRIGIAWLFAQRTVLRTGFGIYHRTATQGNYTDGFNQQTPYVRSLNADITPDAALTGPYSLQNPFPNGLINPSGRALGLLTNVGNAVSFDGRQRVIPRAFQYSLGLQRQLPGRILLDASYVGSVSTHETMAYNMDYLPLPIFLAGQANNSLLTRAVANPFYGIVPPTTTFGASTTIAAQDLYYPYPLFNGVTMQTNPWGRYRYDSLQLKAEKRFAGNRTATGALTMIFGYTFSKNFQSVNRLNNWDLAETPVHELVSYDKPQNVSLSGIWDLPVGKGRHFLNGASRPIDAVVGGWSFTLIYRYNSGNPVNGIDAQFTCAENLLLPEQTHDQWFFDTKSCYKGRASFTLRVAPDRYPWLRQMDNTTVNFSGAKTFSLTERRWKFNLRGEAFNLMNHPLYGAPDTTYSNARFGMLPVGQQNFPRLIQVSGRVMF